MPSTCSSMHGVRRLCPLPSHQNRIETIPLFLLPRLGFTGIHIRASFSTSATREGRSRNRGVSALRGTGPRQSLSISKEPLPRPVLDPSKRTKIQGDENHGLWQFFYEKKAGLITPAEDAEHGRSWKVEELRHKSWEDLHSLWWICVKERNRIATHTHERKRLKAGYGDFEAEEKDKQVKKTQKAIKHALTERWYAWDEARKVAREDPEVDLANTETPYSPLDFEEDESSQSRANASAQGN